MGDGVGGPAHRRRSGPRDQLASAVYRCLGWLYRRREGGTAEAREEVAVLARYGTVTIKWDGQAGSVCAAACAVLYSVEWCTVAASGLGGLCLVVWLLAVWLFGLSLCLSVWLLACLACLVSRVRWSVEHTHPLPSAAEEQVRDRSQTLRSEGTRSHVHAILTRSSVVVEWSPSLDLRACRALIIRQIPTTPCLLGLTQSLVAGWSDGEGRSRRRDPVPRKPARQQPDGAKRGRGRAYRRGATPCEPRSSP